MNFCSDLFIALGPINMLPDSPPVTQHEPDANFFVGQSETLSDIDRTDTEDQRQASEPLFHTLLYTVMLATS